MARKNITFHIDGENISPENIDINKVGKILQSMFAMLNGNKDIHFNNITKGSACLNFSVKEEEIQEIRNEIYNVSNGGGTKKQIKAKNEIFSIFKKMDVTTADFCEDKPNSNIISFYNIKNARAKKTSIEEYGAISGELIRVGGKDNTIPVHIKNSDKVYCCNTTKSIAKKLGNYLYKNIKVKGNGKWIVDGNGRWILNEFAIDDFDVLNEDESIFNVIDKIKNIDGNDWVSMKNYREECEKLRGNQ